MYWGFTISYNVKSSYAEGNNKTGQISEARESGTGSRILDRNNSAGIRLSPHLEPSSTGGTKALAGYHLPGMLKQEPLLQVRGSTSPLPLSQLNDSL